MFLFYNKTQQKNLMVTGGAHLQQVGHNCLLLRTPVARVPAFFRRTQSRCGQNHYRYNIWCMRVLVEPTFFGTFPEVWTCNGLFAYSPGLGCLCRPLTTRNLGIRHAQTWGGLLLPFVRLYVWPTTVISLYGGKKCHFSMTASCA